MDRNKEMAELTLKFLSRAKLEGGEVPAFVAANNWLNAFIQTLPTGDGDGDVTAVEKTPAS